MISEVSRQSPEKSVNNETTEDGTTKDVEASIDQNEQDPSINIHTASIQQTQMIFGSATPLHSNFNNEKLDGAQEDDQAPPPTQSSQHPTDCDPIDLEEVQKIQARMPVADPDAPVGSNKNPIRIIQQGNQYITTQDVSDDQLQQIIQVLTNQALISNSSSQPSSIYNRVTNRRIIFRVTRAKRRHEDEPSFTVKTKRLSSGGKRGRPLGSRGAKRKFLQQRRLDDPDFEPDYPEEQSLPFPLARKSSASGRMSKPPKHLVKDYKRLDEHGQEVDESEDDAGYSETNDWLGREEGPRWPCPVCSKVFNSRAGVARHHSISHGPGRRGRGRGRPLNSDISGRGAYKLRTAIADASDGDLLEFAAPRLAKLISPWDNLLLRCEHDGSRVPQIPQLVREFAKLYDTASAFFVHHLHHMASPEDDSSQLNGGRSDIQEEESSKPTTTNELSSLPTNFVTEDANGQHLVEVNNTRLLNAIGLPHLGTYLVSDTLNEAFLSGRSRNLLLRSRQAASAAPSNNVNDSLVAMDTADDDAVHATLRSDETSTTMVNGGDSQQPQAFGDDLLLHPEGGLGAPIPDEWITSGAFLSVLLESGEPSELAMEASTGRLFHRPTGHLVSLAGNPAGDQQQPQEETGAADPADIVTQEQPATVNSNPSDEAEAGGGEEQDRMLQQIADNGGVLDLETLFPGVSVTEVSPGVCAVTKPNGDQFNVEHGGEGITLETLQAILQMES